MQYNPASLNKPELWKSVDDIRGRETQLLPVLEQFDIELQHISIRYIETYTRKAVSYHGKVESPHLVLCYVFNGSLKVEYSSGTKSELVKNHQYTYFLPGNDYTLSYPANTLTSWMRVVIDKQFIDNIINRMFRDQGWIKEYISQGTQFIDREGLPLHPRVLQCFREISNPPVGEAAREMYFTSKVMELISFNLSHDYAKSIISIKGVGYQDLMKLNEVKEYLHLHYLDELSLKGLSQQFGLNEFKLKKGFKSLFGNTVFGYISDLKMHKAQQLLAEGFTVSEVSSILGYSYPQHFSTAFKKKLGRSPGSFS